MCIWLEVSFSRSGRHKNTAAGNTLKTNSQSFENVSPATPKPPQAGTRIDAFPENKTDLIWTARRRPARSLHDAANRKIPQESAGKDVSKQYAREQISG